MEKCEGGLLSDWLAGRARVDPGINQLGKVAPPNVEQRLSLLSIERFWLSVLRVPTDPTAADTHVTDLCGHP
eukprot:8866520-Pyramimonas_sp.AAC.1